jgi:hypothetical protein
LGVSFAGNLGDELLDPTETSACATTFLRLFSERESWRPGMELVMNDPLNAPLRTWCESAWHWHVSHAGTISK